MMRALVLILAAIFAACLATPADAGPLVAAIGTAVSAVTAAVKGSAILAFAVRTAVSIGLSLLAQALAPKPKQPGIKIGAVTVGEGTSQAFPIGRTLAGGHMEYQNSHGQVGKTPNAFFTFVVSISDVPGVQLRRVRVNDDWSELGETAHADYGLPILKLSNGATPRAWVRWHDGTQTTADAMLVAKYAGDPDQPWTTDHKLLGVAYAVVTLQFDRSVMQGLPRIAFEVDGIPLYDPRLDDTVGGTGAHRWADPATWTPSDNPAVQAYNLLRGIPLPDGEVYGGQIEAEDLPLANWVAGMNVCDTVVNGRAQYRAGMMIETEREPAAYIEELLKAGAGQISETGGVFRTRFGPPATPVVSLTDDDISVSDPQELRPFPGLAASFNAIRAAFPDPEIKYETRSTPLLTNATWEAEDRGRRLPAELSLPAVWDGEQAQQLAASFIADERRFRQHQLVLPPEYQVLEPLDTLEWTSARNGYTDKVFEVSTTSFLPGPQSGSMMVALTLRERDAGDFDPITPVALPAAPDGFPLPVRTIAAGDWSLSGVDIVDGAAAARRPALLINWDPETVEDARHVEYQVQVNSGVFPLAASGVAPARDTQAVVMSGIIAGTAYRVRLRPEIVGRETDWSEWKTATAPATLLTEDDLAENAASILASAFSASEVVLDRPSGGTGTVDAQITAVTLPAGINVEMFITLRLEVTCLASNLPIGVLIAASGPGGGAISYTPQIKNFFAANGQTDIVAVSANVAIPTAGVWNFQVSVRAFDTIDPGKAYNVKVSSRSLMVLWRKL